MEKLTLFLVGCFLSIAAHAVVIGGPEVGWTIDFGQVTEDQKDVFSWFDNQVKTKGFRRSSAAYSAPGATDWKLDAQTIVMHGITGPASFSVVEVFNGTTLQDVKNSHYRSMSGDGKGGYFGFESGKEKCVELLPDVQSCEIPLLFGPSKVFYAVFYEWKVDDRKFVLAVRNAQPTPDRKTPEAAARVLVNLIRVGPSS